MTEVPLLEVKDLRVEFRTGRETVQAVNGVHFNVNRGEVVAVLGESGSGKSVTAATIMRLLPTPPAKVVGGEILFKGRDILTLKNSEWRQMLGREVAMVLQDALTALNPVYSIGWQIAEVFRVHGEHDRRKAYEKAISLLERVGIPAARQRANDYPHQFSGGMRQRVMIAMAVACRPSVLLADEPTTALDVTIQAQILAEVQSLAAETGTAMLWITHDLSVIAGLADRIAVMYAGRIVETGSVVDVLERPIHPYTGGLIGSVPSRNKRGVPLAQIPGMTPSLAKLPPGCPFSPRCPRATVTCRSMMPAETPYAGARMARCHHPLNGPAMIAA